MPPNATWQADLAQRTLQGSTDMAGSDTYTACRSDPKDCMCHHLETLRKSHGHSGDAFEYCQLPLTLLLLHIHQDCYVIQALLKSYDHYRERSWSKRQYCKVPSKPIQLEERQISHNAWVKKNILVRHYKSFPLQVGCFTHRVRKRRKSYVVKYRISSSDLSTKHAYPSTKLVKKSGSQRGNGSCGATVDDSKQSVEQDCSTEGTYIAINLGKSTSEKSKLLEIDELEEALDLGKPGIENAARFTRDPLVYVTAGYPDNHNPNLSRSTQRKLDQMSPREFLSHVLNNLSLEERESLMIDEKQRRKTFLVNWPHDGHLSGAKMAESGFYSVDSGDRVQCVFCRGSLHRWGADETPMIEHAKAFAFCRFVKGLDCGNKEYRNNLLSGDELKHLSQFPQLVTKKNRDGSISVDSNLIGISTLRAEVVKYAPHSARLRTFARWPAQNPIEAVALCDAGFYYTGFDDQVRCFYCSGTLRDWKSGDEPFEEHARWFPDCSYLLQLKGEKYIDEVHARTEDNKKCRRETALEQKQVKEKRQQQSLDESMVEMCVKLGHDVAIVRETVEINGGPYNTIKEHLEAVYELEESTVPREKPKPKAAPRRMVVAEEDLQRLVSDAASGQDVVDSGNAPQGSCITCYRKTLQSISAHYIGLPCGHMLYCEKCNQEEMKRSLNTSYKHKCTYTGCGAPLTTTYKTFYA